MHNRCQGAVASVAVRLMVTAWTMVAPTMTEKASLARLMSTAMELNTVAVAAMIVSMLGSGRER